MGEARSKQVKNEKFIVGKPEVKRPLEKSIRTCRKILNWILNRVCGRGLDSSGSGKVHWLLL
jgi:hypothetical protein